MTVMTKMSRNMTCYSGYNRKSYVYSSLKHSKWQRLSILPTSRRSESKHQTIHVVCFIISRKDQIIVTAPRLSPIVFHIVSASNNNIAGTWECVMVVECIWTLSRPHIRRPQCWQRMQRTQDHEHFLCILYLDSPVWISEQRANLTPQNVSETWQFTLLGIKI